MTEEDIKQEEAGTEEAEDQKTEEQKTDRPADASEADRFEKKQDEKPEVPEGVPERFLKDGRVDVSNLAKSYSELEKKMMTKTEMLKEELREEVESKPPESADKYELPEIEGIDVKDVEDHPMLKSFREKAFEDGLSNEMFQKVVSFYIDEQKPVSIKELQKDLGENAQARIDAADLWLNKQPESVQNKIKLIATDAEGIKMVEQLMGSKPIVDPTGDSAGSEPEISEAKLREMQADPRYYDSARRDPDFVKKVSDGWRKLYPPKAS